MIELASVLLAADEATRPVVEPLARRRVDDPRGDRCRRNALDLERDAVRRNGAPHADARLDAGLLDDGEVGVLDLDELREQWAALAAEPTTDVLVAVDESGVVGAAAAKVSDDVPGGWLLAKLYVLPDRQGDGIGGALHDRIVTDARNAGRSDICLWALEQNARARRFYETRGWQLVPGRTLGKPTDPAGRRPLSAGPLTRPQMVPGTFQCGWCLAPFR